LALPWLLDVPIPLLFRNSMPRRNTAQTGDHPRLLHQLWLLQSVGGLLDDESNEKNFRALGSHQTTELTDALLAPSVTI
jgi:hypothetical protein